MQDENKEQTLNENEAVPVGDEMPIEKQNNDSNEDNNIVQDSQLADNPEPPDEPKPIAESQQPDAKSEASNKKKTKKAKTKNPFLKFLKGLLIFLLVVIGIVLGWVLYCVINSEKHEAYMPENFSTYISVSSVSDLIHEILQVQTVDAILADAQMDDVYSVVKALRSNEFVSSKLFSLLANIRTDVALYSSTTEPVVICANLGFRSAATRLLPLILKLKPYFIEDLNIENLHLDTDAKGQYFVFELNQDARVYFRFYKNLLIAELIHGTGDDFDFTKALTKNDPRFRRALTSDLKKNKSGIINVLADFNFLKGSFAAPADSKKPDIVSNIMEQLSFPERSSISLNMKNENIKMNGEFKLKTADEKLANIIQTKGSVPKALNRLPESTEYFTLLNFQSPDALLQNLQPFLTKEIDDAHKSTNSLCKTFLGDTFDNLILSWIGDEMGVFAVDSVNAPVFFVSIKDKTKCNYFFDKLFKSVLIDRNSTTVVDDIRISRIVFPPVIAGFLKLLKIDLPTPFYFIDGDFVFFSESVEGIAVYKKSFAQNNIITKNEKWKSMLKNISSEASFTLYYNIDRSVPTLFSNNKFMQQVLTHYGTGLISLNLLGDQNAHFDFYAEAKNRMPLTRASNFPKKLSEKIVGPLYQAKAKNGHVFLFWSAGEKICSYDLVTDKMKNIKTDSPVTVSLQTDNDTLTAVWGLTRNGTVYKLDENLNSIQAPVLTAHKSIGAAVPLTNGVVFSAIDTENLIYCDASGTVFNSLPITSIMHIEPVVIADTVIALPRSFDSVEYFFDKTGKEKYAPLELTSISAIKPLAFMNEKNEVVVANITEDGFYSLDYVDNTKHTHRNITNRSLDFSCQIQPVYSKTLNKIILWDTTGVLHLLTIDGSETGKIKLDHYADDMQITLHDITGDNLDEIFISGGGNAIYAYTNNLLLLDGFPIAGAVNPVFADVNSDGTEDILSIGVDNQLTAFEGLR